MTRQRWTAVVIVASIAILGAVVVAMAATDDDSTSVETDPAAEGTELQDADEAEEYWTEDRMRETSDDPMDGPPVGAGTDEADPSAEPTTGGGDPPVSSSDSGHVDATEEYWTDERMDDAQPDPMDGPAGQPSSEPDGSSGSSDERGGGTPPASP